MSQLLDSLLKKVNQYIKQPESIRMITDAFLKAEEKHHGQMRKGDHQIPYITHPVGVAIILADLHAGPMTLAAALLHDTLEDTDYTPKEMIKDFGEEIYQLVDGVTKIGKLKFKTDQSQAEYQRKMLLATANDIRVVLIKIADRLHNIRTLEELPVHRQKAIATETLEIYAPLAHRLGLFKIKAELEDTSLKYNDPEMFYYVLGLIERKKQQSDLKIENIIKGINTCLAKSDIKDYEIKGRIKSIHSIYKKMVIQERDFEDIYDILAIRIIVSSIEECYRILGIVHANYTPIPKRFKDYIAMPKPNMYQSLHTTVIGNDGNLFEVQIRTQDMDRVAELGVAAHWAYKESKQYSREKEQFEMAQKMKWYADLLKVSKEQNSDDDAIEFVKAVKTDILMANVYVFTPDGKVIELVQGATPIDFAYKIHTEIGNRMIGCLINNKIATLDTPLNTGDIVSIKTAKTGTPSPNWIKICKTNYAKNKIRSQLNKFNYEKLIDDGKQLLEKELTKNQITSPLDENFIKEVFKKQGVNSTKDLYLEIGKGMISPKTVINKINENKKSTVAWLEQQLEKKRHQSLEYVSDNSIIVPGLTNAHVKVANCCMPVYGDPIRGYVSKGSGFIVHHANCPNILNLNNDRIIEVCWNEHSSKKMYPTWIIISCTNNSKILPELMNKLSYYKVSIKEIKAHSTADLSGIIKLQIMVTNSDNLHNLITNLSKIRGIYTVKRGNG